MSIFNQSGGRVSITGGNINCGSPLDPDAWKYLVDQPRLYSNLSLNKSLNTFINEYENGPNINLSRATSGTYVDPNGLIKTAPINIPRFTHNQLTGECLGLLVEESRENIIDYSEDVTSGFWTSPTGTSKNTIDTLAPDGTFTASKMSPIIGTNYNFGYVVANYFGNWSNSTNYTLSFFIKSGGSSANTFAIVANSSPFGSQVFWANSIPINPNTSYTLTRLTPNNIPEETISNLGTFERIPYPNGWTKVVWSFTTGTTPMRDLLIYHTGYVGLTGGPNQDMYVWGFQIEEGAFPTSYIRTTGSPKTRSDDIVSLGFYYEGTGTNYMLNYDTNLFQLTRSNWTLDSSIIYPDGNTIGGYHTFDGIDGARRFYDLNPVGNNTYTFSVYARKKAGSTVNAISISIKDYSTDTARGTSGFVTLTNSWQRISVTGTTSGSNAGVRVEIVTNFVSGADAQVYLWGAQVEVGSFATSYIPTTDEIASRPGQQPSAGYWFDTSNNNEGTSYFEYDLLYNQSTSISTQQGLYGIYNPTSPYSNGNTAFIDVEYNSTVNHRPRARIKDTISDPDVEENLDIGPSGFLSGMNKHMVGFSTSTFRVAQNGTVSSTTNDVNLNVLSATKTNMKLDFSGNSQYTGSKIIKRFIFWDKLLDSNQFQSLSS